MFIKEEVYNQIKDYFSVAKKEKGGIIGLKDDYIVTFFGDTNGKCSDGYYEPDVNILNQKIEEWAKDGVAFIGLIHNHIGGCPKLSKDDKEYAMAILGCMEKDSELLFPLVINYNEFKIFWFILSKNGWRIENIQIK